MSTSPRTPVNAGSFENGFSAAAPSATPALSWLPGPVRRRPGASAAGAVVLLITLGWVVFTAVAAPAEGPQALWQSPVGTGPASTAPVPKPTRSAPPPADGKAITLAAVGDIIMGNAPGDLPPGDGKTFFGQIRPLLPADLVMGNMEQPITEDTGTGKCPKPTPGVKSNCHQFRVPPRYAQHLKDAGFDLMNLANNHGKDFGTAGFTNTQHSLEAAGLKHTGATDQITVVEVNGVKVAVLGFSSYSGNNSLINLASAKKVIAQAATRADLVVVQVHMGGEGKDRVHVRPGTESFLGENRGDPMKFSRAVIDAGADLVIGHGPHVVRGMEFYQGRLIAYSLGNFAGGGQLSGGPMLSWGGVLKVTLNPDGSFVTGTFTSTNFVGQDGLPAPDGQDHALGLIKQMSAEDFGATAARLTAAGVISQPTAG